MKKHTLIFVFLSLVMTQLNAKTVLRVDSIQTASIKQANADIKKGKLKFLIQGGIVATRVKGQEIFEQKYGIVYYDFGCVGPSNIRIDAYNKVVGNFMDRKYGKGWRKEVRKDVRGI